MSDRSETPTSIVAAVTVVAVTSIAALTLLLITLDKCQIPEGWLALFIGFISYMVVSVIGLTRVEKFGQQVNDPASGKMDAKIRAGVADVDKTNTLTRLRLNRFSATAYVGSSSALACCE